MHNKKEYDVKPILVGIIVGILFWLVDVEKKVKKLEAKQEVSIEHKN